MGLLQVAKAIAEGKVKPTGSDLNKLIRLEEFLRQEGKPGEQMKIVLEWRGPGDSGEEDERTGGPETEG